MPDSRPAWAWYHTLVVGVIMAIGAIVLQVLIWTNPDNRQYRPLSAATVSLAGILFVAAGLHRKMEREANRTRAHMDTKFAEMTQRVELAVAYQVAVEVQKAQAYADDLFERGMKEMDNRLAALGHPGRAVPRTRRRRRTPRPEDVDRFLSAIDSGDNVVPMPDPRKVKGDDAS